MDRSEAEKRYRALEDCLLIVEALRRSFSRNHTGLVPREGFEHAWARADESRETIQRMMRELGAIMRGGDRD